MIARIAWRNDLRPTAALAALGLTFFGGLAEAQAYCRTASCTDRVGALCEPSLANDCGVPLHWPTSCVGYSLQKDASSEVDLETASAIVRQAFDAWENADCGDGETPSVTAEDLGPVSCDEVEYDQEGKNANIIMFRDDSWPHGASAALALTTVTFALDSGLIRDADVELNSAQANLTTSDSSVDVDLLSILTHETGHFLGLAHTPQADATMFTDYPPMSTTLRSLEPDDVAGICAVFPPGAEESCDPEPVNGLGDECDTPADPDGGGSSDSCNLAPGGASAPYALIALLLAGVRARRRPRSDRR